MFISICMSIFFYRYSIHLSTYLSWYLLECVHIYLSIYLSIYQSVRFIFSIYYLQKSNQIGQ